MSEGSQSTGARRNGKVVLAVAASVALLGAVACGGSDSSASGDGGSAASSEAPRNQATGEPLTIGIFTPDDNNFFNAPELIDGAQAAVEYVNADLGGIGGRPIELVTCNSDQTAPTLTSCANELFQQDPLIIIPGPDLANLTVHELFDSSGIPLIGGASLTAPELTSPTRMMFSGWSASLYPAAVHFAVEEFDAEKITIMVPDDPGNQIIISTFMNPVAEANGVQEPEIISVPQGNADLTSPLSAALETDPDVLLPVGLPCLAFFQAYQSLGTDVPVIHPDLCSTEDVLEQAGAQADGSHFVATYADPRVMPDNEDVQVYTEQMARYAEDAQSTSFTRSGFGTIMNIQELLGESDPNTLTHESVLAAFQATNNQHNFLGTPYSCATPPLPDFPAICSGSAILTQQVDGELELKSDFVTVDELWN